MKTDSFQFQYYARKRIAKFELNRILLLDILSKHCLDIDLRLSVQLIGKAIKSAVTESQL